MMLKLIKEMHEMLTRMTKRLMPIVESEGVCQKLCDAADSIGSACTTLSGQFETLEAAQAAIAQAKQTLEQAENSIEEAKADLDCD